MKRICQYLLAFGVTMLLVASCSRGRVIPRGDMAEIYAEMFLVDQWLKNDRAASRIADTSQVYVPIFEKYGYDIDDYRKTVRRYMEDPERFSRVFEQTQKILQNRLDEMAEEDRLRGTLDSIRLAKSHREFRVPVPVAEQFNMPYRSDTLVIEWDTTGRYVIRHPLTDTLYMGPRMYVANMDSLRRLDSIAAAKADSLRRIDSVATARLDSILAARADSLARIDSLARADSLARIDTAVNRKFDMKKQEKL